MPKSALLIMSLSVLFGCETLPKVPHHVQYGIHADINPPGFYGIDNESQAQIYRPFNDPAMKAGQAMSADDYKSWQNWIKSVEDWGRNHCQ